MSEWILDEFMEAWQAIQTGRVAGDVQIVMRALDAGNTYILSSMYGGDIEPLSDEEVAEIEADYEPVEFSAEREARHLEFLRKLWRVCPHCGQEQPE